ncbi:hypothetical protein [Bifidobacterium biavatii]|uniref:Uncharacterized protein n=1 Tax=Bifidobacterium biavatii DSM 23969 TaxID=1437608 RepID=A0A086ZU34_9BIFI|nr:hypothetical protein [Bifidobacterium biavatii]KFI50034.1 hypothetical protein BBIA_2167 [Bifidobacterium biavatii DSM 23969]
MHKKANPTDMKNPTMNKLAKTFTYNDLRRALADWYADNWQTITDQRIDEQAKYMYQYGTETTPEQIMSSRTELITQSHPTNNQPTELKLNLTPDDPFQFDWDDAERLWRWLSLTLGKPIPENEQ